MDSEKQSELKSKPQNESRRRKLERIERELQELRTAFAEEAVRSARQAALLSQCVAIVSVLNRKGFITNGEIKDELTRLQTQDQPNQRPEDPAKSSVQP